ncbi:MAG: signal peptidase I [Proteobacteria bacterium]|nr:signal peptidase I [Pseudomonadota bacterium]
MSITAARKNWLAVLLSLIMPGLGQVYCGELIRGGCFLVFFIFSPLLLARITVMLPDYWMLPGMGAAVALALTSYVWALVDGWRLARTSGEYYQLRQYNGPVYYLALWLVGTVMILTSDQHLRDNAVEAYKIVGKSMMPAVLPGDYVLVKKPAYRNRAVKKGDIIIAVYPDDRSKALIRQIASLPGEIVTGQDGSTYSVPHGTVMVKGSSKEAIDSSTFGPLDMRDIVGRVTQIYFSWDDGTVRWARIAVLINS